MTTDKLNVARLRGQKLVSRTLGIPVAMICFFIMRYILQYRIVNQRDLRAYLKELVKTKTPLLICSNHLTYIDSGFIMTAFGSMPWYFFHYQYFSWNLPAAEYQKNPLFRFVVYLNKGIFIRRGGGRSHITDTLDVTRSLLEEREVVTIFPEGTRSKTGNFQSEKLKHGTAKIVAPMKHCRVLCCYVRGDKQKGPSSFPPFGSRFYIETEVITFNGGPDFRGSHAIHSEMMSVIGKTISGLEKQYFAKLDGPYLDKKRTDGADFGENSLKLQ